ncbi:MAG: hypothetical protein KIT84_05435 [Labilithrix sp.]|nr:hypothetical protein [Labilithrix sp.]MCW5810430.1 hypothetical protein [Labilithrix sp.]
MAQEPTPPPTEPIPPPPPPPTVQAQTTVSTKTASGNGSTAAAEETKDDGTTDHEKVVGHFGVGYFGVTAQPIGTGAPNAVGRGTVQVPVIGARYWLSNRIGIDGGLGLNFFSSSRAVEQNGAETTTDGPAVIAFALHAGVPIAFAYGKHYKFLAVPEINFGYATQTEEAQNPPAGAPVPPDIHRSGLRFDVGARIGTEIQFGFIGIPELALQASVGLNFRRRVWNASQDTTPQPTSSSDGATDFGTTVQADPWALFTNNIAAIYYFP